MQQVENHPHLRRAGRTLVNGDKTALEQAKLKKKARAELLATLEDLTRRISRIEQKLGL